MQRQLLYRFSLLALFVFFIGLLLSWVYILYSPFPLQGEEGSVSVKVYPGDTLHNFSRSLYTKKLIKYPGFFVLIARIKGYSKKLKFGEYQITQGMNLNELMRNVTSGQGLVKHRITFVEGWTFREVFNALQNDQNLFHRLKNKKFSQIMSSLGFPEQSHPEGLFMPDTYTFVWGNTDVEILKHAYERMKQYLEVQWAHRVTGLPYKSAYEALIVASLIEKEASLDSERVMISSVIVRRLEKQMRLQVDPTVLYGLGKPYGSKIMRRDLQEKNPYNTYQVYGLPPTPIDIPGKKSIYAALHPAHTDYLYYVACGDGTHVFSANYQQHLQAVKKYRAWLLQQRLEDRS